LAAGRRLVRRAIEQIKGDLRGIDFGHISAVLDLAAVSEGHGRLQGPGLDVMRSFNWLRFAKPVANGLESRNYGFPAAVPGILRIPGLELQICLELTDKWEGSDPTNSVYNNEMCGVNWLRVSGPLQLRNWRPGDQYQPQGFPGAEKIKTLFQEFRVPLWERRHWPVLTDGSSIVWAHRFGPAAEFAAAPESGRILKIREMRIVPDQRGVYNSGRAGREGQ
jgi:tRNA(Ile)-lysidine synthase